MAAMVLNSPTAVQMSVYVVRAFVKLREVSALNTTLAWRLETLERSVAALDTDTPLRSQNATLKNLKLNQRVSLLRSQLATSKRGVTGRTDFRLFPLNLRVGLRAGSWHLRSECQSRLQNQTSTSRTEF
jgi:hypothetical protein